MILFGIRSPLVVEVEETLLRLDRAVTAAVSVNDTPRILDRRAVVDLADFEPPEGGRFIPIAFQPQRRAELAQMALDLGLALAESLVDPTAILPRSIHIGDGTFINAGSVIGGATAIGEMVLVSRSASIGHHVLLGDRVSIGPGATLAGNIRVGEDSVIGAGAVIQPDIRMTGDPFANRERTRYARQESHGPRTCGWTICRNVRQQPASEMDRAHEEPSCRAAQQGCRIGSRR